MIFPKTQMLMKSLIRSLAGTFAALAVMVASHDAQAQVVFDSSAITNTLTGASSMRFPHTVGAGANRLLLVGVSHNNGNGSILSVTYGGTPMVFVSGVAVGTTVSNSLWRAIAPPSGTANIVVTFSASVNGSAGSASFSGVDQIAPLAGAVTASGTTGSPSVTVGEGSATDLVFNHVAIGHRQDYSALGASQTLRWNSVSGNASAVQDRRSFASTKAGATGTVTMTATLSPVKDWTSIGVRIQQVKPEIDITGRGVSIASGSATPSAANHTDFGSIITSSGTLKRTFTIHNQGSGVLNLTGTSPNFVTITGTHAADFTVSVQPSSSIAGGGSSTFTVTFDPSASTARNATINIANNDADENPYTFAITGTGLADNSAIVWNGNTGNGNGSASGTADSMRIRLNGSSIEFSADGGTTWTATAAKAAVTTLTLQGSTDADAFVLDFSGGNPIPSGGLFINGGADLADTLTVTGGTFTTVTYAFANATDGTIDYDGSLVTYTGLETVLSDSSSAANRIFNYSGSAETITVSAIGSQTVLNSTVGVQMYVNNPSTQLTLNAGAGADVVDVLDFGAGFAAAVTINGGDNADTISVARAAAVKASISANGGNPTTSPGDVFFFINQGDTTFNWNPSQAPNATSVSDADTTPSPAFNTITLAGFEETPQVKFAEIDMKGNGVSIVDGDITPSLADHTDFGSATVTTGSVVRTFTIDNTAGTAALQAK